MINLFHFSPCDATKACAELVLEGMGETAHRVDLLNPGVAEASPADVSIVAFPVYMGHVPPIVLERLDKALSGTGKAIGIAVYGNRAAENALNEINEYLLKRGFEVLALIEAIGQHTLCAKIATGRPDATDADVLKAFGAKIAAKLTSGAAEPLEVPKDPDVKPYGLGVSPVTTDDCIACGICVDECPTQVIELEDIAESPAQCLGCARCIEVCPTDARVFPAEAAAQFEQFLTAHASERREPALFA